MSWPDAPSSPGRQDPAWPEPTRSDASWPEPSRGDRSRHEPSHGVDSRRDSRASSHDSGPSWPEPPRPDAGWPEPPRKDASWPEPPRQDPPSWPDATPQGGAPAWPDASPQAGPASWPDGPPQGGPSWPDASPQGGPSGWPDATPQGGAPAWPDAAPQGAAGASAGSRTDSRADSLGGSRTDSRNGSRAEQPPLPDPVPAWQQPPSPNPGAWANLSTPAPWPQGDRGPAADAPEQRATGYDQAAPPGPPPHDVPAEPHGPPPQIHPSEERTVTYAQHSQNLLNDRAVPSTPMDSTHIGTPPAEDQNDQPPGAPRPGSNLSRDPSDPDHRFVTAGQISGSRTPPPERQQELWNTVFGDNYQAMGDQEVLDDDADQGKPVWMYALGGSVAIALVAALLWAFLAGPLAGEEAPSSAAASGQSTEPPKPPTTKPPTSIGALPKFPGKASPVIGRVPDVAAGISVPRLGGNWQLDQRGSVTIKGTYNYTTRQYVQIAPEKFAQLMSGPLPARLTSYYEQDNLEPVIKQVVLNARKSFFPADNKVRKIAQQSIKVGDQTGRLIAYSLTSQTEKATIVTMAVNTGGDVPAIVYMSIPSESKQLLPDIRTVMNQLRLSTQG
ncbi:hypothetical protein [Nonomuraea sp. SYSU D8015]|uniref:hypothetical protein n=1 Tax=Nonomuraea sp. SYSU D8015 TaxID=2593644 RepID=UPI001660C44B|nr:hypothetical protein [Nonomuraea sp. SYSU D8015]